MITANTDYADALAEHLAAIAVEFVSRVRDDNPDANAEWLTERLPNPNDWLQLAFVLAAAVPLDRSWQSLTRWTRLPMEPKHDPADGPTARRRLTDADVDEIRQLHAAGQMPADIAEVFGVTPNYVGQIASGRKRPPRLEEAA